MEEKLNAYPLKFEPNLKTVIWGGGKIRKLKKLADAPDCIGESWELTGVPGQESVVSNGEYAGRDIKSLLGEFGAQVVGLNTYNKYGDMFPIMVKFIDAAKDLSIQVHPDDDFAKRRHQGMGKTELWYIVSAEDNAILYSGFSHKTDENTFRSHIEHSDVVAQLNRFSPRHGDIFYLPAGRVHSIGAGNFIVEIQQSSDITYRIYDFDRIDKNGKKRELHTDLALEAIDFDEYDDYKGHLELDRQGTALIKRCDKFVSELMRVETPMTVDVKSTGSFRILICISGEVEIAGSNGSRERLATCDTVLLPYALAKAVVTPVGGEPAELISVVVE